MDSKEEELSPLERARKHLYESKEVEILVPDSLPSRVPNESRGWDIPVEKKKGISGSAFFLLIALLFFVAAIGSAFFLLFQGGGSVSTDRVSISIDPLPALVEGGDTITLPFRIENRNPARMESVSFSVAFPEGVYAPEDLMNPLGFYEEKLDPISSGSAYEKTMRVVIFGGENDTVTIPVTIEYKMEGSSAVFVKKEVIELAVGSSPLSITVENVSEVSSGGEVNLSVSVRSNASSPLEGIALLGQYPFGFTPTESVPEPETGSLFVLGTIDPGEEKEIRVKGIISGQDGDERVFRFLAGTARDDGSSSLAVTYISKESSISITRPFLAATLSLNRSDADPLIITGEETVSAILSWVNTLSTDITDAQIAVSITGGALDPSSVEVTNGFFRSSDSTILFNKETLPALRQLDPQDTGNASFEFTTKTGSAFASLRNPVITLNTTVSGRKGGGENISTKSTRTIKIASNIALDARAVHKSGSFNNTGPFPPEVDRETTYTVLWTVTNTVNSVADARVIGTLPSQVRFTGVSDSGGHGAITYDEATREVRWTIGEVPAGTGFGSNEYTGAFQVALTPSASQRNQSPILVSNPTLIGFDRFVQKELEDAQPSIDTKVTTDQGFQFTDGNVK